MKVYAKVLGRQEVETEIPVEVEVPDNATEEEIFDAVRDAAIEELNRPGTGADFDLSAEDQGTYRKDGLTRTITSMEIPVPGDPMVVGMTQPRWQRDNIVTYYDNPGWR